MSDIEKAAGAEDILPERIVIPFREVWKPDISELEDAVVDGKFLLKVGQDLVIQYPEPWRETILWRVQHVFDESSPTEIVECEVMEKNEVVTRRFECVKGTTCSVGHVRLLDLSKNHFGSTNYKDAAKHGLILKIWKAPKKKGSK